MLDEQIDTACTGKEIERQCIAQANVVAVLDGISSERVKIESVVSASVVVAFYIEAATVPGTLSSNDATAQLLAIDTATMEQHFPGFLGLDEAAVCILYLSVCRASDCLS